MGPISREDALEFVSTLLQHFRLKLSAWELQFIQDMETRLDEDQPLTDRQLNKIDEIMTAQARNHGR